MRYLWMLLILVPCLYGATVTSGTLTITGVGAVGSFALAGSGF